MCRLAVGFGRLFQLSNTRLAYKFPTSILSVAREILTYDISTVLIFLQAYMHAASEFIWQIHLHVPTGKVSVTYLYNLFKN